MSKRAPTFELNADNWDKELEKEEIGEFSKADENTISQRKILNIRRSNTNEVKQTGVFKSFTGFTNISSTTPKFSFSLNNNNSTSSAYPQEFLTKIADLNSSLISWIQNNLDKDKSCIFNPVFDDYIHHLGKIKEEFNVTIPDKSQTNPPTEQKSIDSNKDEKSLFIMKPPITLDAPEKDEKKSLFSFQPSVPKPDQGSSLFASLTGGNTSKVEKGNTNGEDDEDYVPPEPEKVQIEEKGSVYTTKCKIYFKHDETWKERGVGNLFIIPPENCTEKSDKFQLLVRTDTNLGNILLNINITSSIPVTLMKNNLSILTIPNPAIPEIKDDSKAVPMLIRVKTAEDAKILHVKFKQFTSN